MIKSVSLKKIRNASKNENKLTGLFFIAPSLTGVCVFVLIPFADVFRRSFCESVSGKWVGLRNYVSVLNSDAFLLAAGNTVRFVAVCIPALVALSMVMAVLINESDSMAGTFKTTFLLPMAVPVASAVLLWKVLFHDNGLLNGAITMWGKEAINWMNSELAFWVLVISYLWKNMGYDVILWLASLTSINPSLYEAARVDGAGPVTCFMKITLPGMLPSLFTIAVLSLLNSFKVFREAYLIGGSYPHTSMYMLQHLFNNWFTALDTDKLCAGAVMMASVIFVLILILRKAWGSDET